MDLKSKHYFFDDSENEFLINIFNKHHYYGIYVKINYISVYSNYFEIKSLWKTSEESGNETINDNVNLSYDKDKELYQNILDFLHNKDMTDERQRKLNQLGI